MLGDLFRVCMKEKAFLEAQCIVEVVDTEPIKVLVIAKVFEKALEVGSVYELSEFEWVEPISGKSHHITPRPGCPGCQYRLRS